MDVYLFSINTSSFENDEHLKAKSMKRLMEEIEKGWKSAEEHG